MGMGAQDLDLVNGAAPNGGMMTQRVYACMYLCMCYVVLCLGYNYATHLVGIVEQLKQL